MRGESMGSLKLVPEKGKQAKEGTGQLLSPIQTSVLSPALDLGDTEVNKTRLLAPQAHRLAGQMHMGVAKTTEWAEFCGLG